MIRKLWRLDGHRLFPQAAVNCNADLAVVLKVSVVMRLERLVKNTEALLQAIC